MQLNTPITIVCPACKTKQTAFIMESEGFVTLFENAGYTLPVGQAYILCVNRKWCQHLITGDELEKVTRPTVKGPSDIYQLMH